MKQINISISDDLHSWLVARAAEERITLEQLVEGLLVTEKGEQYHLPDDRYFTLKAQTYRGYAPLVPPAVGRNASE